MNLSRTMKPLTLMLISASLILWFILTQRTEAKPVNQTDNFPIYLPLIVNMLPPGATLFSDDFENESYTLSKWSPVDGVWKVFNGKYYCSETSGRSLAGESYWGNYVFVVDVMGVDIIDKIVFFRHMGIAESYGVNVRSNPYNDIVLVKSLPGKDPQILASAIKQNYNDAWYSLKIVAVNTHIQIYVNDNLTIDYYDNSSPILYGRIGVGGMLRPESRVFFDNVKVTVAKPE